jgi:hypothetical protein
MQPLQLCRLTGSGGVAVPDVVQVDLRQPGRGGELLEPPGDRVGVRGRAVPLLGATLGAHVTVTAVASPTATP